MKELEVKQKTFKLFGFEEFPMEELNKIDKALNQIGYSGKVVSNGNFVYTKDTKK